MKIYSYDITTELGEMRANFPVEDRVNYDEAKALFLAWYKQNHESVFGPMKITKAYRDSKPVEPELYLVYGGK